MDRFRSRAPRALAAIAVAGFLAVSAAFAATAVTRTPARALDTITTAAGANLEASPAAEPTETPEATETPEPTETPEATETSEPTETPEATEAPKVAKTPEPTETPEAAETPEATAEDGNDDSQGDGGSTEHVFQPTASPTNGDENHGGSGSGGGDGGSGGSGGGQGGD